MRSTNELPRSVARARSAVDRALSHEDTVRYFTRPGMGWREGAVKAAGESVYEWARAAAALLAWGLS